MKKTKHLYLVHRKEFEHKIEPEQIRKGHVIRVLLKDKITDSTGYVTEVNETTVFMTHITGLGEGKSETFDITHVEFVEEILSSPLFYRLRRLALGELAKDNNNIY